MAWLERRLSRRGQWIAAPLVGAAGVLAFAPFEQWWLAYGVAAGLFWLLSQAESPRQAALTGFLFGAGFFLTGVSWVYVSLSVFGGMPFWLAGIATLGFCLLLAAFPAGIGYGFARWRPQGALRQAFFFAALWALADWSRTWVLTGFPWLALGYSQTGISPLTGWAPVAGVFALSFFAALLGPLALGGRRGLGLAVALILASLALKPIHWTQPQGDPLSVALLQGNIPQEMKWNPDHYIRTLQTYYRLVDQHPAQLTVLPETALPAFVDQLPPDYLDALTTLARRQGGDLLAGALTGNGRQYWNSAISLGTAPHQTYSKSHLVPFGEFIPPGFRAIMALAHIPMSDFTPGSDKQPPLALARQQVAVNICYEDVFGEALIGALPQATLLVNLSNTAWFGDSLAQAQHLQIARIRALETGRPMLRATNTGMTAIINPRGEVEAALPPFTSGALMRTIHGYAGKTPFASTGNLSILVCLLLTLVIARRRP